MKLRHGLLRALYAAPAIPGRDRLIGAVAGTFVSRPVRVPGGLLMDLDAAEWVQLDLLARGEREPKTLRLISKLVRAGDQVLDVGAHVGHHAIVAAKAAGVSGMVHAFDPQPYNADRVARNVVLNKLSNVTVVCAAVGSRDGFTQIAMQSERDRARLSLATPGPNDLAVLIEVPLRRLDTYLQDHGVTEVRLLKIDVEGYELEVLRGMGSRLQACRNVILELLEGAEPGMEKGILDLLADSGFELRDVDGNVWVPGQPLIERNVWASLR